MPQNAGPKRTCQNCWWYTWTWNPCCGQCGQRYPARRPIPQKENSAKTGVQNACPQGQHAMEGVQAMQCPHRTTPAATPSHREVEGAQVSAQPAQNLGAQRSDAQAAGGPADGAQEAPAAPGPTEQKLRAHHSHTRSLFGPEDHRTQAAWKELQAFRDKKRAERPTHQKLNIAHQELLAAKRRAIEAHNMVEEKQRQLAALLNRVEVAQAEVQSAKKHACDTDAAVAQAEGQIETLNGLLSQEAQPAQAPEQALHKLATALLAAIGAPELSARISEEALQQLLPVLHTATGQPQATPKPGQTPAHPDKADTQPAEAPRDGDVPPKQEAQGGCMDTCPEPCPTQVDTADERADVPMADTAPAPSALTAPFQAPAQATHDKHVSSPVVGPELKRAKHRTKSPANIARA